MFAYETLFPPCHPQTRLQLSDFGFSKDTNVQSAPSSRVGTPAYLAPEVISNKPGETTYDGMVRGLEVAQRLSSCGVAGGTSGMACRQRRRSRLMRLALALIQEASSADCHFACSAACRLVCEAALWQLDPSSVPWNQHACLATVAAA